MDVLFADTSALAKVYLDETGSNWLRGILDPARGATAYVARITAVELISAITRRSRSGSLDSAEAVGARAAVRRDVGGHLRVVEITEALVVRAMALAETHALRGYDAVQLAAALELNDRRVAGILPALTLLSADAELNAAAVAEGLAVENPNDHP